MNLWVLIGLMGIVTYFSRASYLLVPIDKVPKWVEKNLEYIPIAILSSIIAPSLLIHEDALNFSLSITYIISAIITILIYLFSKKPGLAVFIGLSSHVILKLYL